MPTPQLDDRKRVAELACDHGWVASDVRTHERDRSKPLFEVHYVNEDAGIVVFYNSIDKLVSAHLQVDGGRRQDHAYRLTTLEGWLAAHGQPIEKLTFGNGQAKLLRANEIVAEATRHPNGEWVISLPGNDFGVISINGLPENMQRRILLAVLEAL